MKRRNIFRSLLPIFLPLLWINLASSSPLKEPNLCGQPACEPSKKFNYAIGTKYTHKYSIDVTTLFRGTSQNKSTLYTDALIHITFFTPCQGLLQISDVTLSSERPQYDRATDEDIDTPQLPKADEFANAVSAKSLRFSFQDGAITELCPDPSDPVWVLNFKRGILSAFHNTMVRFDVDSSNVETDVNGECLTSYQLQEGKSTALVIHKEKEFLSCRNRYKYRAILQTDPYNFGSSFQTVPLVKSRHRCEFSIDRKMYQNIECEEVHTFQPFSQAENGSQAITRQKITLFSEFVNNASLPVDPLPKRVNLMFDHNATPKPTSGELRASRDLIKALCRLDTDNVHLGYPEAFTRLIQVGRRLSYAALVQIYNRAGSLCPTGRKHISDVLPYLGSNAAVAVMVENIGKVVPDVAKEWLVAISFIPAPDEETLSTFVKLLNHSEPQVLLSMSALGHSFCKHQTNCLEKEPIQKILQFINDKLRKCNETVLTPDTREEILISLKAIGNLGLSDAEMTSALKNCILTENRDIEVRTAAVTAHRRLACLESRDFFLDVYRNSTIDTEIRIASYLQVMKCPNYHIISLIRQQLDREEVNQVGSFVWSHLQNQLRSSMPTKVLVQTLLTDRILSDKFNKDRRKFSRSYETSMFFDEFNAGGNLEGHLIFSPKSYFPRTLMANLTLDLFGETVNVIEVETRAEGMEHLVEDVFGPGGPISATKVNNQVDRALRFFRSAGEGLKLAQELNAIPNVIDNNFKSPKLSLGYKVFGNEIFYSSVSGHREFAQLIEKVNPLSRLKQILSGQEFIVDKASMFAEGDYIVPTGVGLPVTLSLHGTSAIHLNMAGNVRSLQALSLDLEGKLKPSVAIEVTGEMGVDAFYASTGIKLQGSIYTATAVEGHVKVDGKTKATVSFNLPKERGDVIIAQTKLIVMKGDKEEEQSGITERRVSVNACSWPSVDHTLGLKGCVQAAFPNASSYTPDTTPLLKLLGQPEGNLTDLSPSFLLSGPSLLAVTIHKADPTAERYVLQYRWEQEDNTTAISLIFDTPGSKQHRELSARLLLDNNSKNLTLLLQGVDNKFEAHGKYKFTPMEKYLDFSLDINGKKHMVAQVGIRTKAIKHGFLYQPKLYLSISSERIAELSGTVKITEKKEIMLCEVNLDFRTKKLSLKVSGFISKGQASWSTTMTFNYQFAGSEAQRLMVELRVGNTSSKSLTQYNGDLTVESTAYNYLNFESSVKYQRAQGHAECKLVVNTKPELKDDRYKFTTHVGFSVHRTYDRSALNAFIEITKPISNIDLRLAVNFNGQDEKSATYLTLRYATGKEVTAALILAIPRTELLKFDGKLNVTLPGFVPMVVILKLDEKKANEYDINLDGIWFSGHNLTASGVYTDKSEGLLKSYSLKLFIQSPSFEDVTLVGRFVSDEHQFKLEAQAEQMNDKYAIVLKHALYAPGEMEAYAEIRYKASLYSVTSVVNLMKPRQIVMEIHLDKYRDVHIILSGINQARLREAGLEVKWDANRDPSQRFAGRVRFQNPQALSYSADVTASYPGRNILGSALFAVLGTKFDSGLHLEWSQADVIDVRVGAVYTSGNVTGLKVNSQLLTPFSGWKRTSLSGGYHSELNLVQTNGSVWWQDDQMVGVNLYWDYKLPESSEAVILVESMDEDEIPLKKILRVYFPDFWCAFNASLSSTVAEIKPVHAALSHRQERNSLDTVIHWQGKAQLPVLVRSRWSLDDLGNATKIGGNVTINSPYEGYYRGLLIGHLYYTSDLDVDGNVNLNFDREVYYGTIKGHVKSLRDSMLVVNFTTPIPMFSAILGRVGYSEANRHLVCMWTMPASSLGVELKFAFEHTKDFDLLFHFATPLDFLSRILLVGKRKEDLFDARFGFNQLLLGTTGSWRYDGVTNFDYKYSIFTPLGGFEETAVVAKVVIHNGLDIDFRVRVAGVKVGATLLWTRKTSGYRRVLLKMPISSDEIDEDEPEALRWRGACILDTYIYPTITCDLDLDEISSTIVVESNLVLPQGNVYLYDEFYFEDMFTIKNDLQLLTPFSSCPELTSVANWYLIFMEEMLMEFEVHVRAHNVTQKGGMLLRFKKEGPEEEEEEMIADENKEVLPTNYAATLQFHTPWVALRLMRMTALIELNDINSKSNLTILTDQTWFTVEALSVVDKEYVKIGLKTFMTSPTYSIPEIIIEAKRDVTDFETVFDVSAQCPHLNASYSVSGLYGFVPEKHLKFSCQIETTMKALELLKLNFAAHNESNVLRLNGKLHHKPELTIEVNGVKNGTALHFFAENHRSVSLVFDGVLGMNAAGKKTVQGKLIRKDVANNIVEYKVDTELLSTLEQPLALEVALEPETEGSRSVFVVVTSSRNATTTTSNISLTYGHGKVSVQTAVEFGEAGFGGVMAAIQSSLPSLRGLNGNVNVERDTQAGWSVALRGSSNVDRLNNLKFNGNYLLSSHKGKVGAALSVDDGAGEILCSYSWIKGENIAGSLSGYFQPANGSDHSAQAEVFFKHPGRNFKFISTGLNFDLDRLYRFGTNATLSLPSVEDVAFDLHLKLPRPGDVHSVIGKVRHTSGYSYIAHSLQYSSQVGQAVTASSGEVSLNKTEILGNVKVEWGNRPELQTITNVVLYKKPNTSHVDLQYMLHTPYYPDDTVVARLSGICPETVWDIKGQLFAPRSNQIASAALSYLALDNINGTLTTKTPFTRLPRAGAQFQVVSDSIGHYRRYLTVEWPNNTAVLKSDHSDIYTVVDGRKRDVTGHLLVEIPLTTRHVTDVTYEYQDAYPKSSGECVVNYNKAKLLNGQYNCLSEAKAGYSKDDMNITVQNEYFPLGTHYIHEVDYDGSVDDAGTLLSKDRKWADVFRLNNRTAFNIAGELLVKSLETGKEIKLSAIQANSTADLETDYHFLDHEFTHRSRLQLGPTVWVSYYLDIINKTTDKQDEGNARLDIAYPNRNFTLTGTLRQDSLAHESQLRLDWDRQNSPKTVGAGFDWYRASRKPDQQVATLRIKHPSFVKDVTFNATYVRHGTKSLVTRLEVEYCEVPEKKLLVEGFAQDLSTSNQTLYQLDIIALHPATRLDLNARGSVSVRPAEYQIRGDARYKRSFLSQQNGHLLARVDGNRKEIDFQKQLQHEESYLKARFYNDEPCCTRLNGSLAKTQVLNYTGDFVVDLEQKILLFVVNMTPDGTDNFKAHGYIPDARNAELNVWRTYDDLAVTDIACYLRINHSRLITSRLKWRPTLKKEILHSLEEVYIAALKNLDDTVDYWKEYIRSEVKESIADVYYNSKPYIQNYLDDLEDLKSLEGDFERLRTFLNDSYNRNDFYVKDVGGAILLLVDELALKKHIEHLPAIMREIWQALGDSGESMRKSLIWIIETIKSSYRKAVELIHGLLHGDSSAKLSSLLEEWIARYDRTIKELQMTVLRHIEQLYNSILESYSEAWNNFLKAIEPTYIKIVHYMEEIAWSTRHEILGFLYERQAELRESPFFLQVANMTQDLDRFYKDLTNRDLFTNIQDYSTRFYNLLKERFIPKIPFGKEIQQVVNEIIEGFQELEKLPSISYFVKKKEEAIERVIWFWKSLDLGPKVQKVATIYFRRLFDMTVNALQSENRYREAKTKFIFEPMDGLVLLEQKLPMSWHAFNETPRFEEIPEYRTLVIAQSYIAFTNKTFWTFYYDYKPYTEIQNWLPPFKAQSIIAGSQHLLTFDGRILTFRGDCDYLLARDFVNDNFSLVMRRDETTKDDQFLLSLITPLYSITIDIFNDDVVLPGGKSLPAQIGHLQIYKEHGVVTVEERDGFMLQCNLLFQVCTLSLSGWYYGKTAGLLGTMDHEPTTDLLSSDGFITDDIETFTRSWALNPGKCGNFSNRAVIPSEPTEEAVQECNALFHAKSSHFSACFGRVDPNPFLKMCLVSKRERCSAAAAYVQACLTQYTLLTIPDNCVQCMTVDGKLYGEGSFIKLDGDDVPMSADIVFIIEAKKCNEEMTSNKNMDLLLTLLAKGLDEVGLKDNRYATVVFGGNGVYDKPRTLLAEHNTNKQDVFTTRQNTLRLFQKFTVGNGTEDIFEAIAFASTLQFRPGVSKLFVVLPCSSCDPSNMTMEYSVLRQVLLESNARLHLIINDDFGFDKQRLAKIFYGMDSTYAYTKKDFRDLKGDKDLRRQAKLPKSMMAYCAPLALETNGTVFAAKWLVGDKKNPVKKFISVVGKRIAISAEPAPCQNCECSSYDTGMGYMDCQPCDFPSPIDINLGPKDYEDGDGDEDYEDRDTGVDEYDDSSGSEEGAAPQS